MPYFLYFEIRKTHSFPSLCTFLFASALQTEYLMIGTVQLTLLNWGKYFYSKRHMISKEVQ